MTTRRRFLGAAAVSAGFPMIIPARVLGRDAPGNTIQIGQIGFGRIAKSMDVPGILSCPGAKIVAIAEVDARRLEMGRRVLGEQYAKAGTSAEIALYRDYRELLARPEIDAVAISTPDHWHCQPAVEAAFAGKDVYVQKPLSLTVAEGRLVSDAIRSNGRVFLLGSQLRSSANHHRACELVRNGRLGRILSVEVGLPTDPPGGRTEEMPVPETLDYDRWLGSTPAVYYTEDRVHAREDDALRSRPGWLRCEQFGAGMITGWGAHDLDIAHWGMGWESTGPVAVEGTATFNTGGLWDVHGPFDVTLTYADGTPMRVADRFPSGVRFIGEKGWIFVGRGKARITDSDPVSPGRALKALDASDPALLEGDIGAGGVRLPRHEGPHHQNWIDCIRSRAASIVPVETAHRSCSVCLLSHIAMKLGRKLAWDPAAERFAGDDEANGMLARAERAPHGARRAFDRLSAARRTA